MSALMGIQMKASRAKTEGRQFCLFYSWSTPWAQNKGNAHHECPLNILDTKQQLPQAEPLCLHCTITHSRTVLPIASP